MMRLGKMGFGEEVEGFLVDQSLWILKRRKWKDVVVFDLTSSS